MIQDSLITFLDQFPRELATIILAMTPIGELRVAIPVAAHVWLIDPFNAFILAVIGNIIPFFPLYYGLNWIREIFSKKAPWVTRVIDHQIERSEKRLRDSYAKYGALALFLFTAIPLPLTGLWSATLAAVALKIPVKYALIGIIPGVVVAGIIVSVLSISGDVFF